MFEVDEEEHGPPARVQATGMKLPRLYETFRLAAPGAPPRDFAVISLTFDADFDRGTPHDVTVPPHGDAPP